MDEDTRRVIEALVVVGAVFGLCWAAFIAWLIYGP